MHHPMRPPTVITCETWLWRETAVTNHSALTAWLLTVLASIAHKMCCWVFSDGTLSSCITASQWQLLAAVIFRWESVVAYYSPPSNEILHKSLSDPCTCLCQTLPFSLYARHNPFPFHAWASQCHCWASFFTELLLPQLHVLSPPLCPFTLEVIAC